MRPLGEAVELREDQGAEHGDNGDGVIADRNDPGRERAPPLDESAASGWRDYAGTVGAVQCRQQIPIAIWNGGELRALPAGVGFANHAPDQTSPDGVERVDAADVER